jgi:PAS domain S-box-containing protein
MITLTMQTILYVTLVTYLISLIVLCQVYYHNRKKHAGLSLWVLAWAFLLLGFGLLCLRGLIPDWISIVVANSSIVGGTLLIYFGLCLFTEKKLSRLLIGLATAFFAIFTCVNGYFTFVQNDLLARSYNVNIAVAIIYFTSLYLLFFGAGPKTRRLSTGTAIAFSILILVELARILGFALGSITGNDFLKSGAYDTAMLGLATGAGLYLTFSLVLMVHRRLQLETEDLYQKVTRSEANTKYLNSLLGTLRGVNQLINREKDRERLIEKICDLISETRGFFCTWILLFDEKRRYVSAAVGGSMETRAFSQQLEEGNYPPCVDIILAHKESLAICGDIVENGLECLLKRSYSGGHALISRLEYEDKVYGTVGIYVQSDYVADPEEQSLFTELAGDIALALYNIDREEILKQSEERFRIVFECAPDAYYLSDLEGNFTDGNKAAERLSGYAKEELIGKSFLNLNMLRPQDVQKAAELLIKNASGQWTGPDEFSLTRKDGSQVMIEISTFPVKISGQPLVLGIARDVTKRKQAEQALLDEATRWRLLMKQSKDGIVVLNQDGRVYDCNQKFADMIGYPLESMHRLTVLDWEYLHPPERTLEMIRDVDEKGDHFETKHRRKDGSIYDVEISTNAAVFAGQKLIFCVCRDITERKQAEEALKDNEQYFRTLFEQASDSIYVLDMEGKRIVNCNRQACIALGYSPEEILQLQPSDIEDILTPEEIAATHRRLETEESPTIQSRHRRKDGTTFPVEIRFAHLDLAQHRFVIGAARDITERKRAEEALRQSEQRYRTILERMADSYFEVDLGGHLTFINSAGCHHLGYSMEELIGMSYKRFTAKEYTEPVFQIYNEVYRTGELNRGFHWKIIRKDGTTGLIDNSISPLRNDEGEIIGFSGVGRDVTDRKKMEAQLIITDRLASVGELASGIAHELNSPLTGIIGLSQLLTEKDLPGDIKEDIKLVYGEAQRAANVVRGLLTFARKHPPVTQLINVNDVIGKTLELRAYEQKVSNIKTAINLATDLPEIRADFFQLQQVFFNIVTNAEYFMLKAHNKGTLTITTERVGDIVRISFADDGPGISEKDVGHIFDPFFTTKESGQGTGLGLSISHGIVVAHDGQIYAASEQGNGSGATFVVELPIRQKEETDEKQ